jgi:hypothetical protein
MTKKTEKELKQRIDYLERKIKVFEQLVHDSYKLLLKHANIEDKKQINNNSQDYKSVFDTND